MNRWELINLLIAKYKYTSYLEIGVQNRLVNYDKIACFDKYGVDPNPVYGCNYQMTSDEFFNQIPPYVSFDIVFIDGLHHYEQVLKDLQNCLSRLRPRGTIIIHDTLPHDEPSQFRDDLGGVWYGDVWKAVAKIRVERRDLFVQTIDSDCGMTIVRKRRSINYIPKREDYLNWEYFKDNKEEMMNVVPPPDLSLLSI